jgi:hypothetical protein
VLFIVIKNHMHTRNFLLSFIQLIEIVIVIAIKTYIYRSSTWRQYGGVVAALSYKFTRITVTIVYWIISNQMNALPLSLSLSLITSHLILSRLLMGQLIAK